MTLDISLALTPNGDAGYTLVVGGAEPAEELPRPPIAIDAASLDRLRRGQSLQGDAQPVEDAVSTWLLGADLAARLTALLGRGDRLRLALRADPMLLPLLSELPVELVRMPKAALPLILHPAVTSLVRVVPPDLPAIAGGAARDWPLRVLIVRTNPADMGGVVPKALPIAEAIRDVAAEVALPEAAVFVDVLTSEEPGADPADWDAARAKLRSGPWDVLVYLGHGTVAPGPDGQSVGYLLFEEANGGRPVSGRDVATELAQHPARVVILAGCLTGAGGPLDPELDGRLPTSTRGAQGVAQAIVGSEAPVDLAVGMRDLLETNDARRLLGSFFRSLLKDHPGDVELAVREARSDLFGKGRYPPSWASPVIYVKDRPPVFPFIAEKPRAAVRSAELQAKLDATRPMRNAMVQLFLTMPGDKSGVIGALSVIGETERATLGKAAMVRPRFVQAEAGAIEIPVDLLGSVTAEALKGTVVVDGQGLTLERIRPAPRLAGRFAVLSEIADGSARFSIETEGGAAKLAPGPLFTIGATVAGTGPRAHTVTVTRAVLEPDRPIWPGWDVVAVP